MRRIMYFRLGGKDVHMPKLIGAFILFASLIMFVKASADMFNSWDVLKNYEKCINGTDVSHPVEMQKTEIGKCKDYLKDNTGISLMPTQPKPTSRQFWSALLGPIAAILFWLAILFLGLQLYKTGDLILPIEESSRPLPEARAMPGRFRYRKKK